MGFDGKLSLHPSQVLALHAAFQPSETEVARARGIIDLFAGAGDGNAG